MYPYQQPQQQQVASEGSRTQPEAYQYYQRQAQDRQYTQTPQGPQQPQQPQQSGQQIGNSQQYYQNSYTQPQYYYQVPSMPGDTSQSSNPQDRYQPGGIYRYGNAYATAPATTTTTSSPAAAATAAAPGARPAPYQAFPYGDMSVMQMMYPQQQPQLQSQHPGQTQASPQTSTYAGNQLNSPHLAAQRSIYPPNQAALAGQYRGMQPAQAAQPQLAPMPIGQHGRAVAPATPPSGHRATVSTHLSAIPVTMPVTDPTGQTAPPGIKPRVTTTLWEDEGTTCFQVEARGFCVARREDNDMINGTKLLNVAGMTRGRRDGLLKGERNRHVVKAGAMHLKGVWIPYDRALDFANKERIVDLLYPLFVTDIKSVLYQPGNQDMRHAVPAGAIPAGSAAGPGAPSVAPAGATPQSVAQHQQQAASVVPSQQQQQQHAQHAQHVQQQQQHAQQQQHQQQQQQQQQLPPHIQQGQAPGGNVPTSNGPPGAPAPVTSQGGAGGNGTPGPVGVVHGAGAPTGSASAPHLAPVVSQIEGQSSEQNQEPSNSGTQLPHLAALGQAGIDGHQTLPQSPYGLGQAKPKTEIEESNDQARHYAPQHPDKAAQGQYYGYETAQTGAQTDGVQQQQAYYS